MKFAGGGLRLKIKMSNRNKRSQCTICKGWMRSDHLERHMKTHQDILDLPDDQLEEELRSRHEDELAKEVKRQRVVNTEKKKCMFCPREYLQQQHCNHHMRFKHGYQKEPPEGNNIECRYCSRKYKNQKDCERHMKENHNYDAATLRKKEREAVKKRKSDEDNLLKESKRNAKEVAKKRKLDEDNLLKESKRNAKEAAKKRKEEVKAEKKRRSSGSGVVPFDFDKVILAGAIYCGKCNKIFTSKEERDKHEERHDDPKNFMCRICNKTFKKMDNKCFHETKCGNALNDNPRNYTEDDDENDEDAFSLVQSALRGSSKVYRLKFARGIRNLDQRLQIAMDEASDQLFTIQRSNLNVKYYISLHCTFYKAAEPDTVTDPPVVLNSGPMILLPSSIIKDQMLIIAQNIQQAITDYERNGSGWNLLHLNSIDLNAIRYNPLSAY